MKTVAFRTFGCKLNQAETASLVREFEERGYRVVPCDGNADVFVLNSCTVTARSDAKCRQAIRHVLRKNPRTTVIVTGCYSQVASEEVRRIPGVDYVVGTQEKLRLFDHFEGPGKRRHARVSVSSVLGSADAVSREGNYEDRTRAFLKIQDGCDHGCAYCIVPLARGSSRSVALDVILDQTQSLIDRKFKEIVLTGVHIGKYGHDLEAGSSLATLLLRMLRLDGVGRIRLSSLDPEEIDEGLLECIAADSEKICRHFHVPLQSGCDAVLSRMRRRYTADEYRAKIDTIVTRFGDVGLGTDVIVGFPGETEEFFEETYRFIEELPFTYLHVFPYSRRKGTEADLFEDQVEPRVRMERAKTLRGLAKKKKEECSVKWGGRVVQVLFEGREDGEWMAGFSGEYFRVQVPYAEGLKNRILSVRIEGKGPSVLRGSIVQT
jgi:threonylcarbamoyladenosine tRNA methylthiotransferase MtaB